MNHGNPAVPDVFLQYSFCGCSAVGDHNYFSAMNHCKPLSNISVSKAECYQFMATGNFPFKPRRILVHGNQRFSIGTGKASPALFHSNQGEYEFMAASDFPLAQRRRQFIATLSSKFSIRNHRRDQGIRTSSKRNFDLAPRARRATQPSNSKHTMDPSSRIRSLFVLLL